VFLVQFHYEISLHNDGTYLEALRLCKRKKWSCCFSRKALEDNCNDVDLDNDLHSLFILPKTPSNLFATNRSF
jgi:hypothetical protein